MDYRGKNIAVLGLGESGEAAARLLVEAGAVVTVLDSGDPAALAAKADRLRGEGLAVICGPAAERDQQRYDRGVLSPGIDPAVPLVANFVGKGLELIGELELAWEFCRCPAIAITGSNGKTTTTRLVAAALAAGGLRTVAAGNISPPFAAVVGRSRDLDVVTLEVSSFQLEGIRTFRPAVAVWLNLSPNHLDRYPSMAEYRAAKLRVFQNQTAADAAVVNVREELPGLVARRVTFGAEVAGGDFALDGSVIRYRGERVFDMAGAKLRGAHNAENVMAALAVGMLQGVPFAPMAAALRKCEPPPHRCELVRVVAGVEYVNDSKSTSLDSLEKALRAQTRPVVLIAGGKDKGSAFDPLADLVAAKCRCAVLIGEMAARIAQSWRAAVPCQPVADLAAAVALARQQARPGDVVLLSPGTSSYDMFKNFNDRGDRFRRLVATLDATVE